MKIEFASKDKYMDEDKLLKKNYCAINRHYALKGCKDYNDIDKINSYQENGYVITDIDSVFNSIKELGKRIYEQYTNEIMSILVLNPVTDDTQLLKLLYKWIESNGFPYYIDISSGANVSKPVLLKFCFDSVLIYLFELIHKLCFIIYKVEDEFVEDIDDLDAILKNINFTKILKFFIDYNTENNNLPSEAISYGEELLNLLKTFSNKEYSNDLIMKINQALIYIVTTEIRNRDELDMFPAQPVFNAQNLIVLDIFNSLSGIAYHQLITKITNLEAEEIRCRYCKAWVPKKSRDNKYCSKKKCQQVRNKLNKRKSMKITDI